MHWKLIERRQQAAVIVDSTVQPEAVAYPTDSQMRDTARDTRVESARDHGTGLKHFYATATEGAHLRHETGSYAHARKFKRTVAIRCQRTIVGRLQRCIETRLNTLGSANRERLVKTTRMSEQTANRKTETTRLHSVHAAEVLCSNMGKARTLYGFHAKVGVTLMLPWRLQVHVVAENRFAPTPLWRVQQKKDRLSGTSRHSRKLAERTSWEVARQR
jgi:IS5 family transposase